MFSFSDIIHSIGEMKPIEDINTSKGLYELLELVLGEKILKDVLKEVCEMYEDEITEYYEGME